MRAKGEGEYRAKVPYAAAMMRQDSKGGMRATEMGTLSCPLLAMPQMICGSAEITWFPTPTQNGESTLLARTTIVGKEG